MPVWITLSGLPFDCWNVNALGKIASKVGKPIATDKLISTKGRLSYAIVLVEVDASVKLISTVQMKLPTGKVRDQDVNYEHKAKFCSTCKFFGHNKFGCNASK